MAKNKRCAFCGEERDNEEKDVYCFCKPACKKCFFTETYKNRMDVRRGRPIISKGRPTWLSSNSK